MKSIVVACFLAAILSGCAVLVGPPVARVAPAYPAPAWYAWMPHVRYGWGWYRPFHGWYGYGWRRPLWGRRW